MPIKRPDKYEHSNPVLPIADSLNVIGGLKQVDTFATGSSVTGLGVFEGNEDKFKQGNLLIALDTNVLYYLTGLTVTEVSSWQLLGSLGSTGPQGDEGPQGTDGPQGLRGFQGFIGNTGFQGSVGTTGIGVQGFTGSQGFQGDLGLQGFQGEIGEIGYQGFQGFQGATSGLIGPQGPTGGLDGIGGTNEIAWFDSTTSLTSGPDIIRLDRGSIALTNIGQTSAVKASISVFGSTQSIGSSYEAFLHVNNSHGLTGATTESTMDGQMSYTNVYPGKIILDSAYNLSSDLELKTVDEATDGGVTNQLLFSRSHGSARGAEDYTRVGQPIFQIVGLGHNGTSYSGCYLQSVEPTSNFGSTQMPIKVEWKTGKNLIRRISLNSDGNFVIGTTVSYYTFPLAPGSSGEALRLNGSDLEWYTPLDGLTGSGITDYVARWTSSSVLGTGLIRDNGSLVSINSGPTSQSRVYSYNSESQIKAFHIHNDFESEADHDNVALYIDACERGTVNNNNHNFGAWIKTTCSPHQNVGLYVFSGTAGYTAGSIFPGYLASATDFTDIGQYTIVQSSGSAKKSSVAYYARINPALQTLDNEQLGFDVQVYNHPTRVKYIGRFRDGSEVTGRFMKCLGGATGSTSNSGYAAWQDITINDVIGLTSSLTGYLPLAGGTMDDGSYIYMGDGTTTKLIQDMGGTQNCSVQFSNYHNLTLSSQYNSNKVSIDLVTGDEILVNSSYANFSGIMYNDDYSLNYTDRSLVDKGYIDSVLAGVISVTYAELVLLINNSELTPGANYLITDFRTVHHILDNSTSRTGDINTGELEPLIVKAVTINELDKEAISTVYPKDIIYYNINSDIRDIAFYNDDESPVAGYKGQIYFRHDTIQNVSTWYDFRNVKFRRWLVEATAWISEESYTAKDVIEYNDILYKCKVTHSGVSVTPNTDTTNWVKWLDKTINWSWTSNKTLFNVGDITTDNLTMSSPIDLFTFGDYYEHVKDVHIGRNDLSVSIGLYGVITTLNNIIFNTMDNIYTCIGNTFGELCFNNTIGDGFNSNTIGDGFNSNTIGNGFFFNTIEDTSQYNTIGNDFRSNTIGDYFDYNTIGNSFQNNTIGNSFMSNTIGDDFTFNTIKTYITEINFTSATHVYQPYDCEIFTRSGGDIRLRYTDSNDAIVVTNPNS